MHKKTLDSLLILGAASTLFALPAHLGSTDYKASSINNFDFNLSWENVQLEPTGGHEIVVDIYCNKKKFAPKVKLVSDTLIIESIPIRVQLFTFEKRDCTVIVKVPQEKSFDQIKIHTSSGDIKSSLSFDAETIYLQASSGNIKIEEQISSTKEAVIKTSSGSSFVDFVHTNKLSVNASSGNITLGKADSQSAQVETSSGDIHIDSGSAKNLYLSASSGDITCNNFSAGESTIRTTSGNIKLKDFDATTFVSSASSGNITARNLGCQSFDVSTTSGTIGLEFTDAPASTSSVSSSSGTQFISMPKGSRLSLHVSTSSGSFTNAFTNEKISSHVDYNNAINGGGAKVSFTSSSASITLDIGNGVSSTRTAIEASDSTDIPVVIFGDEK